MGEPQSRYAQLIEKIFFDRYVDGAASVEFLRNDIELAAEDLRIKLPKNLGDVIYAFRFRADFPESIIKLQPEGMEWQIELAGRSKYRFSLVKISRIIPNQFLVSIEIPDATPEIIRQCALNDEQALLAIVRYNRLVDIFLGVTTYSMQNHLRTTVAGVGQIEIDEIYVGVDRHGCKYIIPVQAKGGADMISAVQTNQDLAWCSERFPTMDAIAISVQFMQNDKIAMLHLVSQDGEIKISQERHYTLVSNTSSFET